jgi:DNA (cytosine-5)-methyltransferase 3A
LIASKSFCLSYVRSDYAKELRRKGFDNFGNKELQPRFDGKTNCLTSVQKDNLVLQLNPSVESNGIQPYQQNRVYDVNGICPALLAQMSGGTHAILEDDSYIYQRGRGFNKGGVHKHKSPPLTSFNWVNNNTLKVRRLTPIECERLQTVPDNYTNGVSDTQRYRMLGNGWTVDVIAHIFSYIDMNFLLSKK